MIPTRLPAIVREPLAVSTSASTTSTAAPVVCAGLVVADHLCPPLDHLPRAGELVTVDELVLNIGGGAANTAVDLARLGVTAAVRARVGDDIFGRFATETLDAHKVDTGSLMIDPRARRPARRWSSTCGARTGGSSTASAPTRASSPPISTRSSSIAPRVLHIGYFLILPRLDAAELAERFARARQAGTMTVARRGDARPGQLSRAAQGRLPHTDVFVPNTDEAELILGESDPVRQAWPFTRWVRGGW